MYIFNQPFNVLIASRRDISSFSISWLLARLNGWIIRAGQESLGILAFSGFGGKIFTVFLCDPCGPVHRSRFRQVGSSDPVSTGAGERCSFTLHAMPSAPSILRNDPAAEDRCAMLSISPSTVFIYPITYRSARYFRMLFGFVPQSFSATIFNSSSRWSLFALRSYDLTSTWASSNTPPPTSAHFSKY